MNLELTIETLAFGGNGVARHAGKAIFVPLTAPGDRIACRIVRDKGRYAEAELLEILEPAPQRRTPPCPVFGTCGGCQWQHLPYAEQGRWKETIFADLLRRQGGIAEPPLLPLVAAPAEWLYRSRVQFKCRQTDGGFVMGFYRRGSHYVIDVTHCPITDERLNGALSLFRQWLPAAPQPERIPQVDLAVGDDGAVRAVVHCLGAGGALGDYLRPLAQEAGIALFLQQGRKETLVPVCGAAGLDIVVDEPPLSLAYGPGGFAQVNLAQNRSLVQAVLAAAELTGRERVLDLYCGMGNFSLPLARRARAGSSASKITLRPSTRPGATPAAMASTMPASRRPRRKRRPGVWPGTIPSIWSSSIRRAAAPFPWSRNCCGSSRGGSCTSPATRPPWPAT